MSTQDRGIGYGVGPYGTEPYGSGDAYDPLFAVTAVSGTTFRVTYDEEMQNNADLVDASNYTVTEIYGVPVTVTGVVVENLGVTGVLSVIVTHSGATLGGKYTVRIIGPVDLVGNIIDLTATDVTFLTLGTPITYAISTPTGTSILVDFDQDMLTEVEYTPGIEEVAAYDVDFTAPTTYPIPITIQSVTHPTSGDASQATLNVTGMTTLGYDLTISPADSIRYDGAILPSVATNFTGSEVGLGSSSIVSSTLSLTKNLGDLYGWSFEDTSGKITATSTYRADLTVDLTGTTFLPALYDTIMGTLSVSDGTTQLDINFLRVAGVDQLQLVSGALSVSANAAWSVGSNTITLIRNKKGDFYSVLFNDVPIISESVASATGVATILGGNAGSQFTLDPNYQIYDFIIEVHDITSTSTIYSSTWNFLHNNIITFTGSGASTNDSFLTEKGPLVKGWGDATPATKQDVEVRVNGVSVEVSDVNPWIGKITLAVPIPLLPPGSTTVEVDYEWFANPLMELGELNTLGLTLNKWDRPMGLNYSSTSTPLGAVNQGRFPFGLVLGPIDRPKPIQIGHRYLGFERAYTASLNNPSTLLLNQNPHSVAVEGFNLTPPGVSEVYEGIETPLEANPVWEPFGIDTGGPVIGTGIYELIDASTGTFGVGSSAYYFRDVDVSFPSTVYLASRIDISAYTLDGVYTGVSFGFHDNRRLYLVGALLVNGVQHIGLLTNVGRPQEVGSWEIGPGADIEITSSTTFTVITSDIPTSFEVGNRFQILSGTQADVYTVGSLVNQTDGTTTITLSGGTFPADPNLYGNRFVRIYLEVIWLNQPSTYRMVASPEDKSVQVFLGGALSGLLFSLDGTAPEFAIPPDSTLQLETNGLGQVFWGSTSRVATNTTRWSFYRYGIVPDQTTLNSQGFVVSSEMDTLPENDPNSEWFFTEEFGFSEISVTNNLLLKSVSGSDTINQTFGYGRVETFFDNESQIDVDVTFRLDSGVLGAGDALIKINDTVKEVQLGTLLYLEDPLYAVYRRLIDLPALSLSGLTLPTSDGWTQSGTALTAQVSGQILTTTSSVSDYYTKDLDLSGLTFTDEGLRIFEARFAILSGSSAFFQAEVGDDGTLPGATRLVRVEFRSSPNQVVFIGPAAAVIQTYTFDWTDGLFHTYRVLASEVTDTVSLVIDDVVQVPVVALSSFDVATTNTAMSFGHTGVDATVVEWDALNYALNAPTTAKRTIGVWLGGDRNDLNYWKIPRTDSLPYIPNSSSSAVPEEMNWTSDMEIRIRRDKDWGVTVYRPDLALPPYFTGDFATQITEPSAGWINVEYQNLPTNKNLFGFVQFGALDSRSISQQRWDYVRYRVYKNYTDDFISPHHMVLNQYNMISSPDFVGDVTPEVVNVTVLSSQILSLVPTQIFADRIFKIVDGSEVILEDQFRFSKDSQTIFLNEGEAFSSDQAVVQVVFAPGKPITETYLKSQPFLDHAILLNEGTPIFEQGQTTAPVQTVVFGSTINDFRGLLNVDPDFILNDPFRSIQFVNDEDALYECMKFYDSNDGGDTGLISTFCDSPAPMHGFAEMAWEGDLYTEQNFGSPKNFAFEYPDVIRASGGSFPALGGVMGPVAGTRTPIMWPNKHAPGTLPGSQQMGANQQVRMVMVDSGVVTLVLNF